MCHLNWVQRERDLYKRVCQEAKTIFEGIEGKVVLDQQHGVCTFDLTMHYSFDFAQQIHIPSNPMQPGPIYFKTPCKCGIFGVMCKGIPRQVNYLIDEASVIGKEANTTIKTKDLVRLKYIFVLTTVQDKTKTIFLSGNYRGEQSLSSTNL